VVAAPTGAPHRLTRHVRGRPSDQDKDVREAVTDELSFDVDAAWMASGVYDVRDDLYFTG
jgi:hypothetical protein